ncbi:hypothetical protein P175DRAFT_0527956 [Aspergillus ochraceoroseus IBT 24754]|uniref:Uncharacterized protein n=2 Tax=Aspergillus ochraceoroseus TaxID=138278 RepID=A0A2T5M7G1_9EURO|nr:uncharacterized protein P175DRAFT_0527956 [Aspergillus ochraceoroseus IBT 24754]KKK22690.1 hypothetical protein AOCH_001126 [Aspergillus ochraceoroseus]PTU24480.1 hypothetical protein P175DRAFT_0527956 [Aspergillus ochraceoroseus IBT 24754]
MDSFNGISDNLYHIILTTSHIQKNPNNVVEKVRVPGTYTSLMTAKAAAHSCLYEAGYERDWFEVYETKIEAIAGEAQRGNLPERRGLMVYAIAPDGTTFRVRINTTANDKNLTSDLPDGRISVPLYYVIQANVEYSGDEGSLVRDINVEGTFTSYDEAREFASGVLLSAEDGITKESFANYTEAAPSETDCGFGENVIVHAASEYGTNYMVTVIKNQELQAVKLAEAAMKIR